MKVMEVLALVAALCLAITAALWPLEKKRRADERKALDKAHEDYRRDLQQSRREW